MKKKSYAVQLLLTLFFGPVGIFYSSPAMAAFFLLAGVFVGLFTLGVGWWLGAIPVWFISQFAGVFGVRNYNEDAAYEKEREWTKLTAIGSAVRGDVTTPQGQLCAACGAAMGNDNVTPSQLEG